jgi:hypothetical protein
MNTTTCRKCGACWIDGQLHWASGKQASESDLAGLVCQPFGDDSCINPSKDDTTGDSWQKRKARMDLLEIEQRHGFPGS